MLWCGAYLASKGIKVIPTVAWSDKGSFDFCFKGIPKGSIVAVSTYMFHESKNHADQKDLFMEGYNRMLKEIEPSKIICYSEPFEEMQGDIIYIDYELTSWQHLSEDKSSFAVKPYERDVIVKYSGYVCKGGGSASGGDWIPKKPNDERFLGEPNTIRSNTVATKNGSYKVEDYYDKTGHAVAERHLTNHNRSDKHSVPHDHFIDWEKGYPDPQPPINCELSPTCRGGGFVRRLVFKFPPEIRQPLFLQACPLRHYRIGLLSPQRYFFLKYSMHH